jgi:phosphoribosylanthranilate isomerase
MAYWVKICGITNRDDARLAIDAGADALGFIFAQSPRQIDPATAAAIIAEFSGAAEMVAVMRGQPAAEIDRLATSVGAQTLQLHDGFSSEQLQSWSLRFRLIRVLAAGEKLPEPDDEFTCRFLIDTVHAGKTGGTGDVFAWDKLTMYPPGVVIVAGGLAADNVIALLQQWHPRGVDASSRLEALPGKKDAQRVRDFIAAVRESEKTEPSYDFQ